MSSEGRLKYRGYQPDGRMGAMFAFGLGTSGELGNNFTGQLSSPVQVGSLVDWRVDQMSGAGCSFGRRNRRFFSFGDNGYKQLGLGDINDQSSPVQVGSLRDWDFVTGGGIQESYFAAGMRGGRLFMWGYNPNGQLGDGTQTNRNSPVQVGSATDWTAIALGYRHTVGIRGGALYAWGGGWIGQLGDGTIADKSSPVQIGSETDWTAVAAGYTVSFGIRSGKLFGWGSSYYGELGDGSTVHKSSPVQIGAATDWIQIASATQTGYGMRVSNPLTRICGKIYSWGLNDNGQLGMSGVNRSSPVQIGAQADWTLIRAGAHGGFGLRIPGKLFAWGENSYGQLGLGDRTLRNSPVQVGTATDWKDVAPGWVHTTAIR